MPLLEVHNLHCRFPDGSYALRGVSFSVEKGEFVLVAGKNGSGKTVLMKHLNGLLQPTEGEILLKGKPVRSLNREIAGIVGLVFENPERQFVGPTVEEDIAFGPENLGLSEEEVNTRVKESMEMVGLSGFSGRNPRGLSGGEKRRVAIAGVLAMGAEIIILDEPFAGLDFPGIRQTLKTLAALHDRGRTIILISHDVGKAAAHADRLIIMENGNIAEDGRPAEVLPRVEEYGVRLPGEFDPKDPESLKRVTWL